MFRRVRSQRTDDALPTYQAAVIDIATTRTGRTPVPDAPRLNIRDLEPTPVKKYKASDLPKASDMPKPVLPSKHRPEEYTYRKPSREESKGYQTDSAYSRCSNGSGSGSGSGTRRKTVDHGSKLTSSLALEYNSRPQIAPLLAYNHPYPDCTPLLLDFSLPERWMRQVAGPNIKSVKDDVLDQLAIKPPTKWLVVNASDGSWKVDARNPSGVTIRDVLHEIREHLYQHVKKRKFKSLPEWHQKRSKIGFYRRIDKSDQLEEYEIRYGEREVDLLCENTVWKGLVPAGLPGMENEYILRLGPAPSWAIMSGRLPPYEPRPAFTY